MSMTRQERNKRMVKMRKSGMTLDQIGKEFGVTRERVRQIVGTKHKNAKMDRAVTTAKSILEGQNNVTWRELELASGVSASSLIKNGIEKPPVRCGAPVRWTEGRIISAALAWKKRTGKFPTQKEWQCANRNHPMFMTVYRRFGNWSEFRRAAGETILDGRRKIHE